MAWFNFLKSEGYFDPKENPAPIRVKEGFQIPHWDVLDYLEKVSVQIKNGNEIHLVDEILSIIKNVSENPKDNYRTWYRLIGILSNMPNDKISSEILNFIPVWFGGQFDTMLQTSETCDKLLPKFLNDNPTYDDIKKSEQILRYLFYVESIENTLEDNVRKDSSYQSKVYIHFFANKFEKKDFISKIIKHCSCDFILELGRTIKFLLLDYPEGVNAIVPSGNLEYEIRVCIKKQNLKILTRLKDAGSWDKTLSLDNWEYKGEEELKKELISKLLEQGIEYNPTDDANDIFRRLNFALTKDLSSTFGYKSIRKLGDRYTGNKKLIDVFSLIFRNLLNEKAKRNPEEALSLLNIFCFDKQYNLGFYKRLSIYIICENWDTMKPLFWEMIKDKDASQLFSNYRYEKELYDLLNKNQKSLTEAEKVILQAVIEQGQQGAVDDKVQHHREYWQLRWYSALNDIEPFKDRYLSLSMLLNITNEHYENLGEVRIRRGSISPISKDDLLARTNQEIADYIRTFKTKDRWEDINISGLAETLSTAVETKPEKFAEEIEIYHNAGYIYLYHIITAFSTAWRKQQVFKLEKVFQYCLSTLKSDKFNSDELKVEYDGWNATAEWVIGAIANFITDVLQHDNNSFDTNLLPIIKEIILIIGNDHSPQEELEGAVTDFPSHSLNSVQGKVLRAALDYSLYRARNLFQYEDDGKWEPEIRSLFDNTRKNRIIDAFIFDGMYFEQFYFLDKSWILRQIKQNYSLDNKEWTAFMGGLIFGNAPFNKELYELFYPHYDRAIEDKLEIKNDYNNGLVRHLATFYFWKFETLSSKGLLTRFLTLSNHHQVGELVNFIGLQEEYQNSLSELEQIEFQEMILELWEYLSIKYENPVSEEEQKILAHLVHWAIFVPVLDFAYTKLLVKSAQYAHIIFSVQQLLENLIVLTGKGNPSETAKSIGEIVSSLNFQEYTIHYDNNHLLRDLVSFLFAHGQEKIAAAFCNKMASEHQLFFLRDIYEANKQNN